MKKHAILTAVLAAFAAAAATLPAHRASGQGKTDPALDALAKEFAVAFNAKDAAKLAAMYTEDALVMPPNRPMVKGRANIEAMFKSDFAEGAASLQLRPMESAIAGSHAYEAGTSTVTVKAPSGPQTINGKYVVVYKRVGSDWKLHYDIFNGDQPMPAK